MKMPLTPSAVNAKQGTAQQFVTHDEAFAARCGRSGRIQSGQLAG
jgi:putative ABC transport system ATP-binding protein